MKRALLISLCSLLMHGSVACATDVTECGYLSTENAHYVLQNDVASDGSCFFVIDDNITLDLNGYTVTYDNATPITISNGSFESGDDNWDLTSAPNADVAAGTYVSPVSVYSGDYALRIAVPNDNQTAQSTVPVTLEANTYYTMSAMIYNQVNDNVTVFIRLDDNETRKAYRTGKTWRGFMYIYKEFKTAESPSPVAIVTGIAGGTTGGSGYVYFDDIRIQRTRVAGVVVGPAAWQAQTKISDVAQFGNANYATVRNGTIQQGKSKSDFSHCIHIMENSGGGWKFHGLTLMADGANSRVVSSINSVGIEIYENHIYNPQRAIVSRDAFDGAAVLLAYPGYGNKIYGNTVHQGVQTAFYIKQKAGFAQNEVYGNTIELQTRHSNDFAIVANSSKIYENIINCGSGDNSCRGIGIGGNDTIVYNNTVNVQELPLNQEYNGCELGGAYGMQMESNTHRLNVYNNTVAAYAGDCEAYAFRANPYAEGGTNSTNNAVHDNTFVAIRNGTARAAAIKYSKVVGENINVYSNIFRTNHRWFYIDGGGPVTNPTFTGNRWETSGTLPTPFHPFEVYTWGDSHFNGTFNCNYYGTGDQTRFESEVFRLANGTADGDSSFTVIPCVSPHKGRFTAGAFSGSMY